MNGDVVGAVILLVFALGLCVWGFWTEFKPGTMPCGCGAEVPVVDGAYADVYGIYCSAEHLRVYGDQHVDLHL